MLRALHYFENTSSTYVLNPKFSPDWIEDVRFENLQNNSLQFFVNRIESVKNSIENFWESEINTDYSDYRFRIQMNALERFFNFLYKLSNRRFNKDTSYTRIIPYFNKEEYLNEVCINYISTSSVFSTIGTFIKCLPIMDLTKVYDAISIEYRSNFLDFNISINSVGIHYDARINNEDTYIVIVTPGKTSIYDNSEESLCNILFTFNKPKRYGRYPRNLEKFTKNIINIVSTKISEISFKVQATDITFNNTGIKDILNPELSKKNEVLNLDKTSSISIHDFDSFSKCTKFYLRIENFLVQLNAKDFPIISKWRNEYLPYRFLFYTHNNKTNGICLTKCIMPYTGRKLDLITEKFGISSCKTIIKDSYKNYKKINKFLENIIEPKLKTLCNNSTNTFKEGYMLENVWPNTVTNYTPLDKIFSNKDLEDTVELSFTELQEIYYTSSKCLFNFFSNAVNMLDNSFIFINKDINKLNCLLLDNRQENCLYIPRVGFLNEFFKKNIKPIINYSEYLESTIKEEDRNSDLATICLYKHLYYIYTCFKAFSTNKVLYVTSLVSTAQKHQKENHTYNLYLVTRMNPSSFNFKTLKTLCTLNGYRVVLI